MVVFYCRVLLEINRILVTVSVPLERKLVLETRCDHLKLIAQEVVIPRLLLVEILVLKKKALNRLKVTQTRLMQPNPKVVTHDLPWRPVFVPDKAVVKHVHLITKVCKPIMPL